MDGKELGKFHARDICFSAFIVSHASKLWLRETVYFSATLEFLGILWISTTQYNNIPNIGGKIIGTEY